MDRLKELNKLSGVPVKKGKTPEDTDLERGEGGGDDEFMGNFFKDVSDAKAQLKSFQTNIKELENVYNQSLQKVAGSDKKATSDAVDHLIDETGSLANQLQARLKRMAEQTEEQEENLGPAETRIRKNIHTTLVSKFVEQMQKYQDVQSKYKQQFKKQAKEQILTVNPKATDEQIEEAVESGRVQDVFTDRMLERNQAAKHALAYVKAKHQEIIKIEQSLNDLYTLFSDMAALVAEQSELLNSIEHNIDTTKAYVEEGRKQLQKANKLAKKRTRTRMILLIVIIIIVIIIGIVVGTGLGVGLRRNAPA